MSVKIKSCASLEGVAVAAVGKLRQAGQIKSSRS